MNLSFTSFTKNDNFSVIFKIYLIACRKENRFWYYRKITNFLVNWAFNGISLRKYDDQSVKIHMWWISCWKNNYISVNCKFRFISRRKFDIFSVILQIYSTSCKNFSLVNWWISCISSRKKSWLISKTSYMMYMLLKK